MSLEHWSKNDEGVSVLCHVGAYKHRVLSSVEPHFFLHKLFVKVLVLKEECMPVVARRDHVLNLVETSRVFQQIDHVVSVDERNIFRIVVFFGERVPFVRISVRAIDNAHFLAAHERKRVVEFDGPELAAHEQDVEVLCKEIECGFLQDDAHLRVEHVC